MATKQSLENLSSNFTTTPMTPVTPSWEDPPSCQPPTRYRILLCMDMIGQPEQCSLGREETDMWQITQGTVTPTGESSDIVIFGTTLRGMPNPQVNPLRYNFPAWPGSISVTAYVQCCGVPETRRCEEKLSGRMTVNPSENQRTAVPTTVNLTNRGSLSLSVTIFCSPNYYGVNCSTFCRDDNQADNRVCHPTTGQLVCSPGWSGINCNEDINECDLGVCLHGAGCNNLLGTFTCHCLRGSSGRFCENRAASCTSQPCLNGGTCFEDLASVGFQCECPPDWTGTQCATPLPRTTLGPSTTETASDGDDSKTEPQSSSDWTLWYVVIALLAVTCVVVIILIICVIWSSRRRRYQISSVAKPDNAISAVATVTTVSSPGQFDNMVYLHDPEDLDLQPASSNLYQRALVSDDPYVNQAALYEARIDPDRPFEDEGQDAPCGSVRPGSLALDNFYASWDCIRQPEDSQYESIIGFQGYQERLDSLQCHQSDTSSTYRRSSDPASESNFYQTHLIICPNDANDTSEMVPSEPNYGRRLSTFKSAKESENVGQLAEPFYDHRFPSEPANEHVVHYDHRFANVSQRSHSESGMSKDSVKKVPVPRSPEISHTNSTKVTNRRESSLTNSKGTTSFKRPCPTPRTNREACARNNNDIPSCQQQNTSQNSGTRSLPHSTSQGNEIPVSQMESDSQNGGITPSHQESNGIPQCLQQTSRKISGLSSAPQQSSRKNSVVPSTPQQNHRKKSGPPPTPQGKRKNSVDLLNQTIGLLQDAPAENSRSKSGSYDFSK
ncbi:uncharacterized protein [Haliotis asinina]|uniref:uncharacterized protein isoform X2 n=1 Tax=Haliotis asinina TaxID=109174 RepID=UPI003532532B